MPLLSGLTWNHKLGEGAFGKVYLGQDQAHGEVAVKLLERTSAMTDVEWDAWRKNFLAEAQHLSRATHEHVVKIHHIAEAEDRKSVVICMAFCPGGSLEKQYDQGPMTLKSVREVATDVLLGLQCLHLREMIHRDIKPANILLDARGRALIGDFGLVTDDLVLGYASQAGYSDHIAYEVWKGKGTSVKSDIWAFGATLYRLLHGRQWYDALPKPRDLIVHGRFADHLPWLPHVPKRWRRVIRQMMEDEPNKRYPSAEATLGAISSLPIAPAWKPQVASNLVRWERVKAGRLHVVEWSRNPRQHAWSAWSEPAAGSKGLKKTLGRSNGIIPQKQAITELEGYLF